MFMTKKNVVGILFVLMTLSILTISNTNSAHANPLPAHLTPLANCALTFVPHTSSNQGAICLGKEATTPTLSPNNAAPGCTVDVYQNGPYGSSAWANGWRLCIDFTLRGNNAFIPLMLNDQASSWDSSCSGVFYANQPGTTPTAPFPGFSSGNFPWGAVGNDTLSSLFVNADC